MVDVNGSSLNQGGNKVVLRKKNSLSFQGLSRATIILFQTLSQQFFGNLSAFRVIFSHIFTAHAQKRLFMVALCNRADHYIFAL